MKFLGLILITAVCISLLCPLSVQADSSTDNNCLILNKFSGEIAKTGVICTSDGNKVTIQGTASATGVRVIGTALLPVGKYKFSGLSGFPKSSVAFQLYKTDGQNGRVISAICPQIGHVDSYTFTLTEQTYICVRVIVYVCTEVNISDVAPWVTLLSSEEDLKNLFSLNFNNGQIGGSNVLLTHSGKGIKVFGDSSCTAVKKIGDITLLPGKYELSGLFGVEKNTVAIQLWELNEMNGKETKILCPEVGFLNSSVFSVSEVVYARMRIIVYGDNSINCTASPLIKCLEYFNIESGGLNNIYVSGGGGGSTCVNVEMKNHYICVTGKALSTGVINVCDILLDAGTYYVSGLDGVKKGSVALQFWEVGNDNRVKKVLCPQIGYIRYGTFTLSEAITVRVRIIVYKDAEIDCAIKPNIAKQSNNTFQSITRLNKNCMVLLMEDTADTYNIYRSVDNGTAVKIATVDTPYYYDWTADNGHTYTYFYIANNADTNVNYQSAFQTGEYKARPVTSIAVLMYHYFATDEDIRNGGITRSCISVDEFEDDLKYLTENNIVSITSHELIQYLKGEIELPEKAVMITIDDGHYSIYKYVAPFLEEYNCKANIAIIGEFVERAECYRTMVPQKNYWMTWSEIAELADMDCFDVGSHSNYYHNNSDRYGVNIKQGETVAEYKTALLNDLLPLNEKLLEVCEYQPLFFAFPYNSPSEESIDILLNDIGYSLLFVGDADYWGQTPLRVNSLIYDSYDYTYTRLLRRVGRRSDCDLKTILDSIWNGS